MERSLCAGVVGFLCLVGLTSMGTKADDQCLDDHACIFFHTMDYDDDNICTYLDFISEWLRVPLIKDENGLTKDVQRQLTIGQLFMYQFPMMSQSLDKNLFQGGVKLNDFRQHVGENRNTPEFAAQLADFVRINLQIFNYDGDNTSYTLHEYQIFFNIFLVSAEDAATAFNKMDTNRDGLLSFDELYAAGYDFFITCLDERNAWFFGPPTTCEEIIKNVARSDDPIALGTLKIPVVASIGTIDILKLLYTYVPEFPILNSVFKVIGIVPNLLAKLIGTGAGLLGK